jgi:hypothetical protein
VVVVAYKGGDQERVASVVIAAVKGVVVIGEREGAVLSLLAVTTLRPVRGVAAREAEEVGEW